MSGGEPRKRRARAMCRLHHDGHRLLEARAGGGPPSPTRLFSFAIAALLSFALGVLLGAALAREPPSFRRVAFLDAEERSSPIRRSEDELEDELEDEDAVYWEDEVERALPAGFDSAAERRWSEYLASDSTGVARLEPGCGRMQNRLATFSDGRRACVRYRQNTDQIQGEAFSYYLARALGLPNLAPSAVAVLNASEPLWRGASSDALDAGWQAGRAVVLTQFVGGLEAAPIPAAFRGTDEAKADTDKSELAQWSDLVAFDYLTANLDRMVNNMYNQQWNPKMMEAPAHNLARVSATGLLLFLDNESGLLHGYRLLGKYEPYHGRLLGAVCVFRRATVRAVRALHDHGSAGKQLNERWAAAVAERPALREALPPLPPHTQRLLQERIANLLNHMRACKPTT